MLLNAKHPKYLHAPARALLAIIFLVSGTGKLASVEPTQKYMEAYGVPGYLIYPAAAFEIGSGAALLTGWQLRDLGIMLAGWCLLTASIFHTDFKDQNQQIHVSPW
jgi:putative oxidoreductase